MQKYARSIMLFGEDNFKKIQKSRVLILGVGGVGSFALDSLYNTGLSDILIVDYDVYEESNQNRQLGSVGNIGRSKVEVLKEKYPKIKILEKKIDQDWISSFDFEPFDCILDCIDEVLTKIHLILKCHKKLLSTSGSAKRIDASKLEYISIWKTYNDPFIRKIRKGLKKRGFSGKYKVVFSPQEPLCEGKGSFEAVTASFGLMLSSIAIQKIISKNI